MKRTGGKIDLQTLADIGVYDYSLAWSGFAENFAELLEKEFDATVYGSSFEKLGEEERSVRLAEAGALISQNFTDAAKAYHTGPEPKPITIKEYKNYIAKKGSDMVDEKIMQEVIGDAMFEVLDDMAERKYLK